MADPLERFRSICLALPGTHEQLTWGHPTFRVGKKIFATFGAREDRPVMTVKTGFDQQQALLDSGDRYFFPSYVGGKGWTGMHLDRRVRWTEVGALVEGSYRAIAPKKLVRELDGG